MADLSQNLHIDQSPQLPTPRRSLFQSRLFHPVDDQEGMRTPPTASERTTTPPILSSSPAGYGNDAMDMSPLPHKVPFAFAARVTVHSPTPETTPRDEDMLSPCEDPPKPLLGPPIAMPPPERKRSNLLRPSLSRTKGLSTNTVSLSTNGFQNQLPYFKFGGCGSTLSISSTPSIAECYTESPVHERKTVSISLMGPPRARQPPVSSLNRNNGSPMAAHIAKRVPPVARPRKQMRRSHSMYQHPGEVLQQEEEDCASSTTLQSIMDIDDTHQPKLPHLPSVDEADSLPRIDKSTLIDVLNGQYSEDYDHVKIIDCRFEYEYNGGHIDGATNFNDKELLANTLFDPESSARTLLIFHCEYSVHRAPLMARFVRHRDRALNAHQYPQLNYPEVYILDGGYSAFFKIHRTRCFPQDYVEMRATEYYDAKEKGMGKLKQRAKLSRAKTFAFGQHSCQMEDSPTSNARLGPRSLSVLDLAPDQRMHARRMASY
ncbi:hypothetical protein B0A49_01115 [Cryomyces minteri]|uniref:M-phase inducer phosphatase n=1 Tax=Cryomyces minteri TaxID=331657 RepID=A0A4U0XSK0_9PEZI|nr:hypothetical protein B0A49_01115 [Cryomyces minteri]